MRKLAMEWSGWVGAKLGGYGGKRPVIGGAGRPFGCQYINWEVGHDGGPCDCMRWD